MVKTRSTPEKDTKVLKVQTSMQKKLPVIREKPGPSTQTDMAKPKIQERQKQLEEENKALMTMVKDLRFQLDEMKKKLENRNNSEFVEEVDVSSCEEDEEGPSKEWTQVKKKPKSDKKNVKSKNNFVSGMKSDKMPPVVCFSESGKELGALLKRENMDENTYKIVRMRENKYQIRAADEVTRQKIVDMLKTKSVNYYTYAQKGSSKYITVLKGLDRNEDLIDLKSEIEEQCGENVIYQVKQISKNGKKLPVYLVLINENESVQI